MRRLRLAVLAVLSALLGACTTSDSTPCGTDGPVCPPNWVCIQELSSCIDPSVTLCGNGVIDQGEECDDGNLTNGDGCNWNCKLPTCGDGFLDPGEVCDDNNRRDGDGCSADCKSLEVCGDGIVNVGEACDDGVDGVAVATESCNINCTLPRCGDGLVNTAAGEECDDNGDSETCTRECKISTCGDGYINSRAGEHCDEGSYCMDGVTACDSPADCVGFVSSACGPRNTSCCTANCQRPTCGNGIVEDNKCESGGYEYPPELCDSGARCADGTPCTSPSQCSDNECKHRPGFGCTANCANKEECGDGVTLNATYEREAKGYYGGSFVDDEFVYSTVPGDRIASVEYCDNGKLCSNGKACETADDCADVNSADRECKARSMQPLDSTKSYCSADCLSNGTCGNGYLDPNEQCDDNNTINGDGCSSDCRWEACGNGQLDSGEVCDFGELNGTGTIPGNITTNRPDYCLESPPAGVISQAAVCHKPCNDRCQNSVCGDGSVDVGETCDPKFLCSNPLGVSDDSPDCRQEGDCADCGIIESMIARGEIASAEDAPENLTKCKDGCYLPDSGKTCRLDTCKTNYCGDNFIGGNMVSNTLVMEECDSGAQNTADCDADCTLPVCGDGVHNVAAGEQCDPGTGGQSEFCNSNCTIAKCGDGIVNAAAGEQCDDGNRANQDGCSSECQIEAGYVCNDHVEDGLTSTVSCNAAACGDGIRALGVEGCDDGNTIDGDGCSSLCVIEAGFHCTDDLTTQLTSCETRCGDNVIAGDETCEDGNNFGGDGCSAACQVEPGYYCEDGPGMRCSVRCGDGIVAGDEVCDDGNVSSLDGCSSSCKLELGFVCDASGVGSAPNNMGLPLNSICTPVCGDGFIAEGVETCDDGNATDNDGCSSICQIEAGYDCKSTSLSSGGILGGPCATRCGDGLVVAGEQCDPNASETATANPFAADGCSVACQLNSGWHCAEDPDNSEVGTSAPRFCTLTATCGDLLIRGNEACDDGNTVDGDGCSADCSLQEAGYTCPNGTVNTGGVCVPTCGDGLTVATETCDDGNTTSGDGCSATCQVEQGWSCAFEATANQSTCAPTCGDGTILTGLVGVMDEVCDEGTGVASGGCINCKTIEPGFYCTPGESCITLCGDGIISGSEQCDDGNTYDNDGCSSECLFEEEDEYDCSVSGELCESICGTGILGFDEECDDGNAISGDGCSDSCTIEPGFNCSTPGAGCTVTCGDGIRAGGEQCDDGNTADGDGCSSACQEEFGFNCNENAYLFSSCASSCGDSKKASNEQCDDGNTASGDGCSSFCQKEAGFSCTEDNLGKSTCATFCGDGIVAGNEVCDVGNASAVGCNNCQSVTAGYYCEEGGQACATRCGDGIKVELEACDDNNSISNDGCSSICQIEGGWECPTDGASCIRRPVAVEDVVFTEHVTVGTASQPIYVMALLSNDQYFAHGSFALASTQTWCGGTLNHNQVTGVIAYTPPSTINTANNLCVLDGTHYRDGFSYSIHSGTTPSYTSSTTASWTLNRPPVAVDSPVSLCLTQDTGPWSWTLEANTYGSDLDNDPLTIQKNGVGNFEASLPHTVTTAGQTTLNLLLSDSTANVAVSVTVTANDKPVWSGFTGEQNIPPEGTNGGRLDLKTKVTNGYEMASGLTFSFRTSSSESWTTSKDVGNAVVSISGNYLMITRPNGNNGNLSLSTLEVRVCESCPTSPNPAQDCSVTTIIPKLAQCFNDGHCNTSAGQQCDVGLGICRAPGEETQDDAFVLHMDSELAEGPVSLKTDFAIIQNDTQFLNSDLAVLGAVAEVGCGTTDPGTWHYIPPADLSACLDRKATFTYEACFGGVGGSSCSTSEVTIHLFEPFQAQTIPVCEWIGTENVTRSLGESHLDLSYPNLYCSLEKFDGAGQGVTNWGNASLSWSSTSAPVTVTGDAVFACSTSESGPILLSNQRFGFTWVLGVFRTPTPTGSAEGILTDEEEITITKAQLDSKVGIPGIGLEWEIASPATMVGNDVKIPLQPGAAEGAGEVKLNLCVPGFEACGTTRCTEVTIDVVYENCFVDAHCENGEVCTQGVCEVETP